LEYIQPVTEMSTGSIKKIMFLGSKVRSVPEVLTECAPLCEEELKVVLKCMGTMNIICCTNHKSVVDITAGTDIWSHADWKCFVHLSKYFTLYIFIVLFPEVSSLPSVSFSIFCHLDVLVCYSINSF
jgi:hypothetical protein